MYVVQIVPASTVLFEVVDIFGRKIRTTGAYWRRIVGEKHVDVSDNTGPVIETLQKPDSVYRSIKDSTIALYRRKLNDHLWLVVVAKHLNGSGFLVTAYQTSKLFQKGEQLWPT